MENADKNLDIKEDKPEENSSEKEDSLAKPDTNIEQKPCEKIESPVESSVSFNAQGESSTSDSKPTTPVEEDKEESPFALQSLIDVPLYDCMSVNGEYVDEFY